MQALLLLGALWLIIWYWWDTMQSKEMAKVAGKRACDQAQVQFLDDTVALKNFRLQRGENGRLQLRRTFVFEFTSDGSFRYQGRITVQGKRVREVEMDAYRIDS
jgi:hypothetical protein